MVMTGGWFIRRRLKARHPEVPQLKAWAWNWTAWWNRKGVCIYICRERLYGRTESHAHLLYIYMRPSNIDVMYLQPNQCQHLTLVALSAGMWPRLWVRKEQLTQLSSKWWLRDHHHYHYHCYNEKSVLITITTIATSTTIITITSTTIAIIAFHVLLHFTLYFQVVLFINFN